MNRAIFATAAAAIVVGGLGTGLWFAFGPNQQDALGQCRGSVVASDAGGIGGPFELISHEGQAMTQADVFDRPSLVYFGYTYCPDVCPLDVARNAIAVDLLDEQGKDVRPVFVTIDPGRDTVEALADYAPYMHEKMIGLTGSQDAIDQAIKGYRVYAKRASEDEDYLMDHSTFTYLMAPDGTFLDFFRRDATPEAMAERTACFVDALGS